ncbi:MAG: DUF2911 domain-containing protein [Flavobacteriaceae bacterium]|nr:DUF2911 domain-containing protein [Flavobacteriaceae bacterium]
MKTSKTTINFFVSLFMILLSSNSFGQGNQIRQSQKSSITQYVGLDTQITINYSRPAVKNRVVWGNMVPYGLASADRYSNGKSFPWRAGANENTTIEINNEVKIAGSTLPPGKYSIHMIPSETDWIIIFNKNSDQWGSFSYDETEDAIRVTVTPVEAHFEEFLTYNFGDITENSVIAFLHWEKLKVPFQIIL